jgi:competence protein ComEA
MNYIRRYWYVLLIAVGALAYSVYSASSVQVVQEEKQVWEQSIQEEENNDEIKEVNIAPTILFVDIKGEVNAPGVYEVDELSRVKDVIMLAGGFTSQAEPNGVNLAQKITDEMVIYVPAKGEDITGLTSQITSSSEKRVVNINDASKDELETLPGVGPSKADAIITFREENGLFKSVDELEQVPGIGEKSLEKLRDYISIQ